jgi:SpoVK/Ycf46/Vps4 family AAA+-type ATPase
MNGSGGNGSQTLSAPSDVSLRGKDFIAEVVPRRRLDDLVLPDVVRRAVSELVEEQQRADLLRSRGVEPRHRVLFVGPPGTGKTSLAEAVAEAAAVPLFLVRYELMIGSYLGETAARLKRVFDYARTTPCVLFFDEFDALARSRDEVGEHNELRRVVNSLLIFIEQIAPSGFLIAATNLDQHLDPAIWRRFDEVIWFELPDIAMITKYLVHAFRNSKIAFDPAAFAAELRGYSYADLEKLCVQSLKASILDGDKVVSEAHFRTALRHAKRRRRREAQIEGGKLAG